jgi:hypothetical protein
VDAPATFGGSLARLIERLDGIREPSKLVGAVEIGLKVTLKTRKLLILLNEKNAKNTGFAQVRYAPGTRNGLKIINPLPLSIVFLKGSELPIVQLGRNYIT